MKTERAQELLKHFKAHGVSQEPGNGLNMVLEYQDIIGHSTAAEVRDFEADLDQESRKNFVWVNFLTLAQDTALDIFKNTVAHRWLNKQADLLEDDYNEKLTDVYNRERTLKECKKSIYKRIAKLETENNHNRNMLKNLNEMLNRKTDENRTLTSQVAHYSIKADKYDKIKGLLATP